MARTIAELTAASTPLSGTEEVWVEQGGLPKRVAVSEFGSGAELNDLTAVVVWANVPNANITVGSVTQHVGSIDHNLLLNYVAAQHVDWSNSGGENLESGRSSNAVLALTSGEVTQLANIGATAISLADWQALAVLTGTNTGDQTSIVGITGTSAQFDTAVTGANFSYTGHTHTAAETASGTFLAARIPTHTGDVTGQTSLSIAANVVGLVELLDIGTSTFLGRITAATGNPEVLSAANARTVLGIEAGATADQTSIVGITGTGAQFDTALTGANFSFSGHTHETFDRSSSVLGGAIVFSNIVVTDGITSAIATRTLTLANLGYTGSVTANDYSHPNHSGHVTSSGDGATTLVVAGITGQSDIGANLIATDEIIVSDGGNIRRADISRLNNYLNGALAFNNYTHPTYTTRSINTSGAVVLDIFTSDAIGAVTNITTRTMTLANLGYTGSVTANDYTHPGHPGDDFSLDTGLLSGAVIVSDIDINVTTDSEGHVTDANGTVATRTLTLANLGYTGSVTANDYTHPAYTTRSINTSGAVVLDLFTSDAIGAVTNITTRTMTLANLGYTGSVTANDYTHPGHPGDDFSIDTGLLGGAVIVSDVDINISTDTQGHVTDANATIATRTLTIAQLGGPYNNYSHPGHPGDDFSVDTGLLGGAVIVSDIDINVTTDSEGHVTDANGVVATRTLTLANLGYTGSPTANDYTHPAHAGDDFSIDTTLLSGAVVISDVDINITTDTQGHVTDANATIATRSLTAANIGAAPTSHSHVAADIPTHTGEVTGQTNLLLSNTAISGQAALTTGLLGTDELLLSDAGVIKRMDISVMNAYFNANLNFNLYVHPNHTGHISSSGDGLTVVLAAAILDQTLMGAGVLTSGDLLLVVDSGIIKRMDVTQIEVYMQDNLAFNNYVHPNHSGHVTSAADGATLLRVAGITGQTALTTGLLGTDELLLSDGGVIKRMDVSVMNAYFNANLNFNNYVHPNHSGHVTSAADGATLLRVAGITGQTALTTGLISTDELLLSDAGVIKRMDISVIQTYMQANLSFGGAAPVDSVFGRTGAVVALTGDYAVFYPQLSGTETITGTWTLDGSVTASDFGTGGKVKDGGDNPQPIGFNVMPLFENDTNDNFDLAHNGMVWHHDTGGAKTWTCISDTAIPIGATYVIVNEDPVNLVIAEGTSPTVILRWFDGGGLLPPTGQRTLIEGGVATLYKYTDTEFWIWGTGIL